MFMKENMCVLIGEDVAEVMHMVAYPRDPLDSTSWKRPGTPAYMPSSLALLMQECWHQKPACRPSFEEIEKRLEGLDDGPGNIMDKMVARQKMVRNTILKNSIWKLGFRLKHPACS